MKYKLQALQACGKEWSAGTKHRFYFSARLYLSSASAIAKVWFDCEKDDFGYSNLSDSQASQIIDKIKLSLTSLGSSDDVDEIVY